MSSTSFSSTTDSLIAPARRCFAIQPDDTANLTILPKALFVGTGGNLVVGAVDSDADVVFANVPSGSVLDIRLIAIRATGTTASDLVGLG
jgi:hypothetical protein